MGGVEAEMRKSSGTCSAKVPEEGHAVRRRAGAKETQKRGSRGLGDEVSWRAWAEWRLQAEGEAGMGTLANHAEDFRNLSSRCNASVMRTSYFFPQWYLYTCRPFCIPQMPHPEF